MENIKVYKIIIINSKRAPAKQLVDLGLLVFMIICTHYYPVQSNFIYRL